MDDDFRLTVNQVASQAKCDPCTVRCYADAGFIECRRLASGMRLLRPTAVAKVRALRAERMSRRGKYPRVGRVEVSA
jgi:hypothetical protein